MSRYAILGELSTDGTEPEILKENNIPYVPPDIIEQPDPVLELYRAKLYSYFTKNFITHAVTIFGTDIFSIKKSINRCITNLLSSWMFTLYIDSFDDPFFPTNYNNTLALEETLRDYCTFDKTITNVDQKIKKIINILKFEYEQLLINYNSYKNKKIRFSIKKSYKYHGKKSFIKLELIQSSIRIFDKKLINMLNNIIISENVYDRLFYLYKYVPKFFDTYVWCILFRYQLLGSNNHQLAIQPKIFELLKKDYNLNFECFASSINSITETYCSVYPDLEKHFGSCGNFFTYDLKNGVYEVNPPYEKTVIEKTIQKIFKALNEENNMLTFFITLPIWDKEGREQIKLYSDNYLEPKLEYKDFTIINELKNSKYFKAVRLIPKEKFTYFDYNFDLYKNKTIQDTYIFVISNNDIDLSNFMNYDFE